MELCALDNLNQDLRHSVRFFRRNPTFTVVAALTLALGVGANTTMFGLVDALMLRPPAHVREPEKLVRVLAAPNYVGYLRLSGDLSTLDLAAYARNVLTLGLGTDATEILTECVTHTYFPLLGVQPVLGRTFTQAEDVPGGPSLVILGYGLWQSRFGGDPAAIGKTLRIANRTYTVMGVAPRNFGGLELEPADAWILLTGSPALCSFSGRDILFSSAGAWLDTIGKLRGPFTLAEAEKEVEFASINITGTTNGSGDRGVDSPVLVPIFETASRAGSRHSRAALSAAGASATLLLIACFNVACLLSIRLLERRQEIAVRLQLGARRMRIVHQLLLESLVLALFSGAVAVVVTVWIAGLVRQFFPLDLARDFLNLRAFIVLAAFTFFSGILSGAFPAMQTARSSIGELLRSGDVVVNERSRLRSALLLGQMALSLALVVVSGLFVRSVQNVEHNPGYDLEDVIIITVDLKKAGYGPEAIRTTFESLLDRVRQIPLVESAGLSYAPLLDSGGSSRAAPIWIPSEAELSLGGVPIFDAVSPGYFAALGTRIVRGRAFSPLDNASGKPVAVLSENLANQIGPNEQAVGKGIVIGSMWFEVVGISESRRSITRVTEEFFIPLDQVSLYDSTIAPQTLIVRPRISPDQAVPVLAAAIRGAFPDLPFVNVRALLDLADAQTRSWRLGATMFGLFGALATALAVVGLYGVLTFMVRRRTREIGIRMALGAAGRDILRFVVRQALLLVVFGWVLGMALALLFGRLIQSQLFHVTSTDGTSFVIASLALVLTAFIACSLPAARAVSVNPAAALRHE